MIFVAARFRALAGARAALRAVRASSVAVAPGDVGVRPLGTTRYDAPVDAFVVAGRFEPGDVEEVIRILHGHGGRILVRRIDSPRASGSQAPARAAVQTGLRSRQRAVRGRRTSSGSVALTALTGRRKRLRRPSPPLRVRTARGHRLER